MESLFKCIGISASGLSAERFRMDIISNNIANADTVSSVDGEPYKGKSVVLKTLADGRFSTSFTNSLKECGVEVSEIIEDNSKPTLKYDPSNPNADENGFIKLSNVDVLNEMVDMISASRAYEANITALNSTKSMIKKAISIGN